MVMKCLYVILLLLSFCFSYAEAPNNLPPLCFSKVNDNITTTDGNLKITCIDRKHGYGTGSTYDNDIYSPKSVTFSPDGKKFYVNSLEGCKTVVYNTEGFNKIKAISHSFNSGKGEGWLKPSGYYQFSHYLDGDARPFKGKPVEMAFSKNGDYLFVPYYRRTFDINAQDPSALAIIDSHTDEIVLMTETGPLPKMVSVSNDGKLLAITHWGDNTVGFIDISSDNYNCWKHLPPIIIGHKLNLNYSLTASINRDTGSGYSLRGTVFLPGDSLLIVGGMGGPTAVIDLTTMKYIGNINGINQVRHIIVKDGIIYFSRNVSGEIYSLPIENLLSAIRQAGNSREFKVEGIRKTAVGGGARTLKSSPDGNYLFVACNAASSIYVVNKRTMSLVGKFRVDSYPVGLDVSPDGRFVVVTSQGRSGQGGNAVNIFKIDYLLDGVG